MRIPIWSRRLVFVMAAAVAVITSSCSGGGLESGESLAQDPDVIVAASAESMAAVESVQFDLTHSGADVYLDSSKLLAVEELTGRSVVPDAAEAIATVNVGGSLSTEVALIAIDDDVWMSNPVTGEYGPLIPGVDVDPRQFFDPVNGWGPLLEQLSDREFVAVEDDLYHMKAVAPAGGIESVTAGLIKGEDIPVDFWVLPDSGLVRKIEFSFETGEGPSNWILELTEYNEDFTISPPINDG